MKNGLLAILLFCSASLVKAQYFEIQEISAEDAYEGVSIFPEIVEPASKSAFPEQAAFRINTYLKYDVLMNVHGKEQENIFSHVFPVEGEFGGQGEFGYHVISNNRNYLSIGINNSFTGAYTEYEDRYYSFWSYTGEHITLQDLFTGQNYGIMAKAVNDRCRQIITDYLEILDPEDEFAADKEYMYLECLGYFENLDFPSHSFFLTDSSIVFTRSRCSNHAMAALDDLWDFSIDFSLEEVKPYLSEKGQKILLRAPIDLTEASPLPEEKVLTGSLDGKYSITAMFNSLSGDYLNGVYWYDKYKSPIALYGSTMPDGRMEFFEEANDERFARMELIYQNGQLMGVWERLDGSASFPVVFTVE